MCILTASPSYLGFPLYQVARQQGSDSIWLGSPPAASRPAGLGAEGWQSLRQNGVCQTSREGTPFLAHLSHLRPARPWICWEICEEFQQRLATGDGFTESLAEHCVHTLPHAGGWGPRLYELPRERGKLLQPVTTSSTYSFLTTWTYLPWPLALSWVPADAFNIRPESGPHPSSRTYVSLDQAGFLLVVPAPPCPLELCLLLEEWDEQRGPASQHQTGAFSVPQQKMRFLVEQT